MKYTIEKKKEFIESKPCDKDVREYCKEIGISYSSYYKWLKELNYNDNTTANNNFVEITPTINSSIIDIEINGVIIHVNSNYDSISLLKLINTLKLL